MDLLEKKDGEIVGQVVSDFEKAENGRAPYEEKWKNNYRLYKNKIKVKREGKANLFIPYMWATVEQLIARTLQALFEKRPYVGYAGVEESDEDGAKCMQSLVDFQMEEKINLPFKFIQFLKSIFIYGTAIALYEWRYEEKTIIKKVAVEENGVKVDEVEKEETIVSYNDPDIEHIPIDDFYPDSEGHDMKTCAFVCARVYKDLKYLKSKEKQGVYELPEDIENDSETTITTDFRNEINEIPALDEGERKKKHELINHYTDGHIITVLNRKHVVRKDKNELYSKEKCFKRILAMPMEKEFWGMSIVEVLADLQEELNTTRNQRIDNISIIINKMFKKRRGADIDDADLVSRAGGVIEMDDIHNDLKEMDFPDVTASAYKEEEVIKQDIQYISGVSEYTRGTTPGRKETATAVETIRESADVIFNYTISVIERTGLLALGDAIKKLNQQYMTDKKTIRLFDKAINKYQYSSVSPESIAGSYDVVSMSPSKEAQVNKNVKRAQLIEMFNTFMNNEATRPYINVPVFMEKIMEQYDIKDYKTLVNQQNPIVENEAGGGQNMLKEIGEENGY